LLRFVRRLKARDIRTAAEGCVRALTFFSKE
jgi:hypothetical protein